MPASYMLRRLLRYATLRRHVDADAAAAAAVKR